MVVEPGVLLQVNDRPKSWRTHFTTGKESDKKPDLLAQVVEGALQIDPNATMKPKRSPEDLNF